MQSIKLIVDNLIKGDTGPGKFSILLVVPQSLLNVLRFVDTDRNKTVFTEVKKGIPC